jgi:hypothetical protein
LFHLIMLYTHCCGHGLMWYHILAFAAGVKKSGYNLDRSTQEKVTDGAREAYEKFTGYVLFLFFSPFLRFRFVSKWLLLTDISV